MDSGFKVLDSGSMSAELGFSIPIARGIPDSLSCISDSKTQDSGLHKLQFSTFYGIRITLHVAIFRL